MNKLYPSAAAALKGIVADGQLMAVGGFGLCGIPEALIDALRDTRRQGPDRHLEQRRRRRLWPGQAAGDAPDQEDDLVSYVGENKEFERQYLAGELELEFTPQGTLAEKLRAGGAGIPAFFTRTGVGTLVAEGKETARVRRQDLRDGTLAGARRVAGQGAPGRQVGQPAVPPDGAQLQPGRGDGRQDLRGRGRRDRRDVGDMEPDQVHLPGIYVHRIVHNASPEKRIEKRTITEKAGV